MPSKPMNHRATTASALAVTKPSERTGNTTRKSPMYGQYQYSHNPHRPYRPSALTLVPLFLRWPDNCGIPDGGGGRLRHTYEIASDHRLGLGYLDRKSTRLNSSHVSISY